MLDAAGFIPVAGAAFDGLNAGLYASEGDWGLAGLSLVALVPFIGDAAAGGRLVAKYGDDVVGAVAKGGDGAGGLASAARHSDDLDGAFFRGAKPGDPPSFLPRASEYRIDPVTGAVRPTHGVSVWNNSAKLTEKGFDAYRLNMESVPNALQIIQRGSNASHFEIVPQAWARLTPAEYENLLCQITCRLVGAP